jgi:hypothetical protein
MTGTDESGMTEAGIRVSQRRARLSENDFLISSSIQLFSQFDPIIFKNRGKIENTQDIDGSLALSVNGCSASNSRTSL